MISVADIEQHVSTRHSSLHLVVDYALELKVLLWHTFSGFLSTGRHVLWAHPPAFLGEVIGFEEGVQSGIEVYRKEILVILLIGGREGV